MNVCGAYMSIQDFLYTYKEGPVHTTTHDGQSDRWRLSSKRELIIPNYQREYRWEEKQLNELLNDITRKDCYLGQITLAKKNNETHQYNLVDGQQRITSIIILITILCRHLYILGESIGIKRYELHLKENNSEDSQSARLTFNVQSFISFQVFLSSVLSSTANPLSEFCFPEPTEDIYKQKDRYISACTIFDSSINQKLESYTESSEKVRCLTDLLENILSTRISVSLFENEDLHGSEQVFLDINEKGVKLDDEDILKAYYFRILKDNTAEDNLKNWKELKTNLFLLNESWGSSKISLAFFVNHMLQIELVTTSPHKLYKDFDTHLRYNGKGGKKHICELFTPTDLDKSIKKITEFFYEMKELTESSANSSFYKRYFGNTDSSNRSVFNFLFQSICKSDMKLVYIALAKIWWTKKSQSKNLSKEDVVQLFAFYIITNISIQRKERSIFDKGFINANTIDSLYQELEQIEFQMLLEADTKSNALTNDSQGGGYLSINIQMFYNLFSFVPLKHQWLLKASNNTLLDTYSSTRDKYVKDHFLIQNGQNILLFNSEIFSIINELRTLRNRAYNFIYHKDDFENKDFVTRLDLLFRKWEESPESKLEYGNYELAYFDFLREELSDYFNIEPSDSPAENWAAITEKYSASLPDSFLPIIKKILKEDIHIWNRKVCKHLYNQLNRN